MTSEWTVALLHAWGEGASSMRPCARVAPVTVSLQGKIDADDGFAWTSWESDDTKEVARVRDEVASRIDDLDRPRGILGFSQGAMLALEVGLASKVDVDAVVAIGSYLAPGGLARPRAHARHRPRVLLLHGEDDEDVPLSSAEDALARLKKLGCEAELERFAGAKHEITEAMIDRAARFFQEVTSAKPSKRRRPPPPR